MTNRREAKGSSDMRESYIIIDGQRYSVDTPEQTETAQATLRNAGKPFATVWVWTDVDHPYPTRTTVWADDPPDEHLK